MTKLGVHDDEKKEEIKDEVKVDHPKVFTVLQPTVIPMPPQKKGTSIATTAYKGLIFFLVFCACFTAATLILNGVERYVFTNDASSSPAALTAPAELNMVADSGDKQEGMPFKVIIMGEQPEKSVVDSSVEEKVEEKQNEVLRQQEQQEFVKQVMAEQFMERVMAERMFKMRRLQQAFYQQQMMREAMVRNAMMQRAQEEQMAQAQMAERSRMEEIAQRNREWEAYNQWAHAQAAQAQAQQAQMAEAQARAAWQQQQQQQANFWPAHQVMQQRPTFWQQPPQGGFFARGNQAPAPTQVQTTQKPEVVEIPTRPHDASPQEIINNLQPIPGIHDRIYEQLQKKSQTFEMNAPSQQIWTAITPTPSTPVEQPTEAAKDNSETILRDIFSAFDEQKSMEKSAEKQPEMEGVGATVVEDTFPRLPEDRTTTEAPTTPETDSDETDDHQAEIDPFASVLKFFEQESLKPKEASKVVDSEATPAAVKAA